MTRLFRYSDGIQAEFEDVAKAVAAEVMRRECISRQNPPPYVGGYHS